MVCPVCGETLELAGYKAGDLLDCEACGAVLRLLSDGTLELVEAPPEGEEEALWGLSAYGEGEEAVLVFSDGTLEEEVRLLKADLLEFTLPSGSVYEFPFHEVQELLKPLFL